MYTTSSGEVWGLGTRGTKGLRGNTPKSKVVKSVPGARGGGGGGCMLIYSIGLSRGADIYTWKGGGGGGGEGKGMFAIIATCRGVCLNNGIHVISPIS